MKRILTILAFSALLTGSFSACSSYDDTEIWEELNALKEEVAALKNSVNALQAYKTLLDKSKVIADIVDNGDGTFTVSFADGSEPVVIKTGRGEAGTPGVTPDFKIDNGDWYVSYDGGSTWTKLGSASSGESFFQNVYMDGDVLVLVLIDGTQIRINPKNGIEDPDGPDNPDNPDDPDDPEIPTGPIADWIGKWDVRGNYQVDIEVKSNVPYIVFGGEDYFPLAYDEQKGTMLLNMPDAPLFTSTDGNIDDWVLVYNTSNKFVEVSPGTLLATLTLSEDKNNIYFTGANASYYYIYIKMYDHTQEKYVGNKHYLYLNNEVFTRMSGGGNPSDPDAASQADWLGNWTNSGGSITFYEYGSTLMCYAPESNFNDCPITLTSNGDGTYSAVDAGYYGWCGTGADNSYYYFDAQDSAKNRVTINKGDKVLNMEMSSDKKTITITTGMSGVEAVCWFCGSTWGTKPSNWLGVYTKAE